MVQVRGAKTQQLKAQKSAPGGHQEQNREIRQGPRPAQPVLAMNGKCRRAYMYVYNVKNRIKNITADRKTQQQSETDHHVSICRYM